MEHVIKYWVVELTTQNPSADDTWNFRDEKQARNYAEKVGAAAADNPDYYGKSHVRVYDTSIVFCDD